MNDITANTIGVVGDDLRVNHLDLSTHHHHPETKYPHSLTAKLPIISPDKIIGRRNELEDLHRRLFDNKQVVLVNGLGGIGKTTLAQACVGRYLGKSTITWPGLTC